MIYAIDINQGRLRILKETAKLHHVDNVITTVHADLRNFVVCNHAYLLTKNKITPNLILFSMHVIFYLLFFGFLEK